MVSNSERLLGIIRDIVLPLDINSRYDVYFTDKRIGIVCMGRAERFESGESAQVSLVPQAFGVPPPASTYIEKPLDREKFEEEIKKLPLDSLLKLSKKSSFYTYNEIEEIKLAAGPKPKFVILSEECESKFSLSEEQLWQLTEILPSIEALKGKLWVSGEWNTIHDLMASTGAFCSSKNDPEMREQKIK